MILIIDKSKSNGSSISEMFHYMGLLSYHVTPMEAFSEVNTRYRAILITDPDSIPDPDDYVTRLKKYSNKIPIFALSRKRKTFSSIPDSMVFDYDIYSSTLALAIMDYQDKRGLPSLGKYMLAGLDLGCDLHKPRYLARTFDITKTETMILRYLTITYPSYAKADEIMDHCLKPGKSREPSVIRAHVSSINKKFNLLCGRNLIISEPGVGYIMRTPEIIEKLNQDK